jgi:hypothetical protein
MVQQAGAVGSASGCTSVVGANLRALSALCARRAVIVLAEAFTITNGRAQHSQA